MSRQSGAFGRGSPALCCRRCGANFFHPLLFVTKLGTSPLRLDPFKYWITTCQVTRINQAMMPDVIKYDVQYEYIQSHLISVWYQGVRLIARFLLGVEITLIRSSNQFGASCGSLFSFDLTAKTPPGPILTIRNWCCKLCHLQFIIETLGLQNGWIGLPKIGLSKIGFPKIGQSNIGHPNIGHPKMGHPAIGHSKNWWSENWWWVNLWSCRFLPGGNGIKWTTYLKLKKKVD